jgi:hypothetical protein
VETSTWLAGEQLEWPVTDCFGSREIEACEDRCAVDVRCSSDVESEVGDTVRLVGWGEFTCGEGATPGDDEWLCSCGPGVEYGEPPDRVKVQATTSTEACEAAIESCAENAVPRLLYFVRSR